MPYGPRSIGHRQVSHVTCFAKDAGTLLESRTAGTGPACSLLRACFHLRLRKSSVHGGPHGLRKQWMQTMRLEHYPSPHTHIFLALDLLQS
jgi:hypothetical protein